MIPLCNLTTGQSATINQIDDEAMALLALRFGIQSGATVTVLRKIPAGPMVFRYGYGELALGQEICQKISATLLSLENTRPQPLLNPTLQHA